MRQPRSCRRSPTSAPGEPERALRQGPSGGVRAPWGLPLFFYQLTQTSVARAAQTGPPFPISILQKSGAPHFQNSVEGPPLLFDFDVHRTHLRTKRARAAQANVRLATCNFSALVCNSALRFHSAPATHVAHLHKTLRNRRAFLCFHRLITAGTPHNRRVIHPARVRPSLNVVAERDRHAVADWIRA